MHGKKTKNSFTSQIGRYNMNNNSKTLSTASKTRDSKSSDNFATKVRWPRVFWRQVEQEIVSANVLAPMRCAAKPPQQQGEAQDAYAKNRRDMDVNYSQ